MDSLFIQSLLHPQDFFYPLDLYHPSATFLSIQSLLYPQEFFYPSDFHHPTSALHTLTTSTNSSPWFSHSSISHPLSNGYHPFIQQPPQTPSWLQPTQYPQAPSSYGPNIPSSPPFSVAHSSIIQPPLPLNDGPKCDEDEGSDSESLNPPLMEELIISMDPVELAPLNDTSTPKPPPPVIPPPDSDQQSLPRQAQRPPLLLLSLPPCSQATPLQILDCGVPLSSNQMHAAAMGTQVVVGSVTPPPPPKPPNTSPLPSPPPTPQPPVGSFSLRGVPIFVFDPGGALMLVKL